MNKEQYEKLKAAKPTYDFYIQVQTLNTAHPNVGIINEVIVDMGGESMNLSCSKCVASGLTSIYEQYFKYEKEHGIN